MSKRPPASDRKAGAAKAGAGKAKAKPSVGAPELEALVRREHSNPHSLLGAHAVDGKGVVVRA
ncbi:MAG: hypothetical protein JO206_05705, partial [Solirubrobacterales bacterium]|nr:hypothetical protein [Solirubrobacterales bacterium]